MLQTGFCIIRRRSLSSNANYYNRLSISAYSGFTTTTTVQAAFIAAGRRAVLCKLPTLMLLRAQYACADYGHDRSRFK